MAESSLPDNKSSDSLSFVLRIQQQIKNTPIDPPYLPGEVLLAATHMKDIAFVCDVMSQELQLLDERDGGWLDMAEKNRMVNKLHTNLLQLTQSLEDVGALIRRGEKQCDEADRARREAAGGQSGESTNAGNARGKPVEHAKLEDVKMEMMECAVCTTSLLERPEPLACGHKVCAACLKRALLQQVVCRQCSREG